MRNYKKKDQWQKKSSWHRWVDYKAGTDERPKAEVRDPRATDTRDVFRERAYTPEPRNEF